MLLCIIHKKQSESLFMVEIVKLPKVAIFTVYRKDSPEAFENMHLYSELVLLDRTHSIYHPLLYKLHLDMLDEANSKKVCSASPPSLIKNAELISCEVAYIDRQKKEITLADMSTVRYKYLIVLHGDTNLSTTEKDEALAAGISTLPGAVRIQNQIERLSVASSNPSSSKRSPVKAVPSDQAVLLEQMLRLQPEENAKNPLNARHVLEFQT